jgi:DedD protein
VDNILKQRLVGALILVALGIVFWPIIFVEPGAGPSGAGVVIPPRPGVDNRPIEPPDTVGMRPSPQLQSRLQQEPGAVLTAGPGATAPEDATAERQLQPSQTPVPDSESTPAMTGDPPRQAERRTRTEAPVSPEIDEEGVPVAWILQVVTVSSEENAEKLRLRLIEGGHKAFVRKIRRDDRNLYRVAIGPGFEKARIEALKPGIDAELKVDSRVQRYLP